MLPSGRAVRRHYTPNGWLSEEWAGQSNGDLSNPSFSQRLRTSTGLQYDHAGRLRQSTDAQGHVWQKTYDACGRPSTATDPLGHVATTTYYPAFQSGNGGPPHPYAGLVQSVTTPGNNSASTLTTTYTQYDALGRALAWTDPTSIQFNSGYDLAGNLTSQSDGVATNLHPALLYDYDTLGRKGRVRYADNTSEQWTYDASGNVASFRNRAGAVKTYGVYDGRNRATGYSWSDGTPGNSYLAYDAASRLTQVANANSWLNFSFDDSGALRTEQQSLAGGAAGMVTTYQPGQDGNVDTITYPGKEIASWTRDHLGRIGQVNYTPAGSSSVLNLATYDYYAGTNWLAGRTTAGGVRVDYGYQNNDRLEVVNLHLGSKNLSYRTYGYYPDGQLSWFKKIADGTNPSNPGASPANSSGSVLENNAGDAYYYQANGQLTYVLQEALNPDTQPNAQGDSFPASNLPGGVRVSNYGYDAAGNRVYAAETGVVSQPDFDGESRQNPNNSNYYDANGNWSSMAPVAGGAAFRYLYNAENQLTGGGPDGQAPIASFAYDPLGRLCARTLNGVTTRLYYAGSQLVEERDGGNHKVHTFFYGAGGERVCLLAAFFGNAAIFFHQDARGFVTHLSNYAGAVVEQYLYESFGLPFIYDASGTQSRGQSSQVESNRFVWGPDYEWYPELGLYRCGARWYSPRWGHWMQPDPIGQAGGLNLYGYCGNDPINKSDPSGLADIGAAGSVPRQSSGETLSRGGTLPGGDTMIIDGPLSDGSTYAGMRPNGGGMVIGAGPASLIDQFSHGNLELSLDSYKSTLPGVGAPGFWESMVPIWGNGRSAVNAFQTGHPWQGAFYSAMAVSDVFLVKSLVTAAAKGVAMVGTKLMAREAIAETGCFTAGTEVYTDHGNAPIEEVKAGDWVLAQVEGTDYQEWKQVLATSVRTVHHLVVLEVAGERIETTLEHPFWVEGRGWTPAGHLGVGDELLDREGARLPLQSVDIQAGEHTVYNFVVADDHDYFVGRRHLLVHNGFGACAKIGEILAGHAPDTMIHLTPFAEEAFAAGVNAESSWVKLEQVAHMTVREYQTEVVLPAAAAYGSTLTCS